MARQRMYLFERAYVDYGARLREFSRLLLDVRSKIWEWFWRGQGAKVIEIILHIAIVVSAISFAVMYIRYESSHGRGFSVGTFFVMVGIVVYALVLLWGWKAPVHFVTRVVAGASAVGSVLLLAILALALASGVFSVYLFVLFVLTTLSFVVFLPMRAAHGLWLLYRHIAYRCPYDDCSYSGVPIHICECGEWYRDLKPSFYGIFNHICRHGGQEVKLPTMDFLGRNKLPRLCGGCERPLIHSSLGELPEWPIAVVGGTSTGKTVFLLQAMRKLQEHFGAQPGSTVRIDSEVQEHDYQQQIGLLDRGQVVGKTAGDVMQAFGLAIRIHKRMRCLLYLYDKPGEDFTTMQRFGRMQAIQHLKGIVLLVDPFSLPALSDHAQRLSRELNPSQDSFRRVVDNLITNVGLMGVPRRNGNFDVPLAVVLSKADAFPTSDYPFLAELCPGNGRPADDTLHNRCRGALEKLGEVPSIRALEMNFSNVQYFACTALGRMPDLRNTTPFQPKGVVEPFLWLLE